MHARNPAARPLRAVLAVLAPCALAACVATGTPAPLFTGTEQLSVQTVHWPDPTQPRTTPREPLPVPSGRGVSPGSAAAVSVVTAGLIHLLDRIPDGDHIEFSDRVGRSVSDVDIAAEIDNEVRRLSRAVGATAAGAPAAPRDIRVTVQLRHGLWKFQNPIYTPKVTANLVYHDPASQTVLQQVVTFYGAEPASSTSGFAPVVDWWSEQNRYRELLRHASLAIARQLVWLVRVDPIRTDPALRDRVLRTSRETNWLDTVSAPCAFDDGTASVRYRAQRRAKEISIAALCGGNPLLQVDSSAQGLVWLLNP